MLHAVCIVGATYACMRVENAAVLELRSSGLMRGGRLQSTSDADSSLRHPHDAERLIPKQRGGRQSVQEIMQQDVAHIINAAADVKQATTSGGRRKHIGTNNAPSSSKPSSSTGAPALLFHLLSLPLCFAHMLLYSPWSWIDPRVATDIKGTFIKPRTRNIFQATTATAILMISALLASMYCLMATDVDIDTAAAAGVVDDGDLLSTLRLRASGVSVSGLLSGLLYAPFLLFHLTRFGLNLIFQWRFKELFPIVATTRERARDIRHKRRANKKRTRDDKQTTNTANALSTATTPTSTPAASAAPTTVQPQSRAESDSESEYDSDTALPDSARTPLDFSLLRDLASLNAAGISPDVAAAAGPFEREVSDPPPGSMEPSQLMQRLRHTPKIAEILKQEDTTQNTKENKKKKR